MALRYDRNSQALKLGRFTVPIERDRVRDIYGISGNAENPIALTSFAKNQEAYHSFVERCFSNKLNKSNLTKTAIVKALNEALVLTTKVGREDVVRLVTLYMLNAFFLTVSGMTIALGYLKIVAGDIKEIKEYDWATHIHEKLMESLNNQDPRSLSTCLLTIPVQ